MNINELLKKYSYSKEILESKINRILEYFINNHNYNPVEHIKCRIKSTESIKNKLQDKNLEFNESNIENNIKDLIGIRLVCSFLTDIYDIVNLISQDPEINIIERKDYVSFPKESGYTSYHLIVLFPIVYKKKKEYVKAEIQIRTVAQDFWASLNHKIQYKYEDNIPLEIKQEMHDYSMIINQLDKKMVNLNKIVNGDK